MYTSWIGYLWNSIVNVLCCVSCKSSPIFSEPVKFIKQ